MNHPTSTPVAASIVPAGRNITARSSRSALAHIPGDEGWPVVGVIPRYIYGMDQLMLDFHRRFGDVARMKVPGSVGLFIFGADNYQRIFLDTERIFSSRAGYEATIAHLFRGALLLQDFEEHRFQRRILQTAFKTEALRQYPELMNPVVATQVKAWSGQSFPEMHTPIKHLLLTISAKAFFGIEATGREAQKLSRTFGELIDGLVTLVHWDVPGSKYHRGLRARKTLESYFRGIIPGRRHSDGQDVLSHMCRETDEAGEPFSDDEILNQAIFLLFAAHDTTTSLLNNLLLHSAMDPRIQERLRVESMALADAHLGFDDLDALVELDHCIDECLRLYPPAPFTLRRTLQDCEISGHRVPANTMLYLPMLFNQRDPVFWSQPDRFDPDRFSPARQEHKRHKFCYHPFGGGAHKCIGLHFARMMAKCFMHQLLLQYRYELPAGFTPRHLWVPLPRPVKLPLRFSSLSAR